MLVLSPDAARYVPEEDPARTRVGWRATRDLYAGLGRLPGRENQRTGAPFTPLISEWPASTVIAMPVTAAARRELR